MLYTQIELTSPDQERQVWWIPVPAGKAKVGEKIMHHGVDWTITAVCTTVDDRAIPSGSRIANTFKRFSDTQAVMTL